MIHLSEIPWVGTVNKNFEAIWKTLIQWYQNFTLQSFALPLLFKSN